MDEKLIVRLNVALNNMLKGLRGVITNKEFKFVFGNSAKNIIEFTYEIVGFGSHNIFIEYDVNKNTLECFTDSGEFLVTSEELNKLKTDEIINNIIVFCEGVIDIYIEKATMQEAA